VFALGTWRDRSLSSASQAGLVNNLNEGTAWGLFPVFFAASGLDLATVGLLTAIAPAVWGVGQLGTGALSDRIGRKWLIAGGQLTEAAGLLVIATSDTFALWATGSALFGAGTAMAYPTLIAAVGDVAHPTWRGAAVGVYRLWRDIGFAVGAVLAGVLADRYSIATAIAVVAVITAAVKGEGSVPPDLLGRLLSQIGQLQRQILAPMGMGLSGMSDREIEVVRLVADGLDTVEIASKLSYSERTIKNILHDITSRLHLRNRAHAVAYALRNGLI
jgi:DNA-binding NarL/FixJ family response regulator